MEFFRLIAIKTSETDIKKQINNNTISNLYPDIIVLNGNEKSVSIGCIWGEFILQRDEIKGGIRYSMLDCPNALAWTITTGYPPARDQIVIHLTINRQQKQQQFIDEINEFLDGWENGLLKRY
jgi:hypothetical protein